MCQFLIERHNEEQPPLDQARGFIWASGRLCSVFFHTPGHDFCLAAVYLVLFRGS